MVPGYFMCASRRRDVPQAPMKAKPQAMKSGSSSRAASLAASAAVSTPAEIRGSDIAAMLSR
jgi:hypothetical protein